MKQTKLTFDQPTQAPAAKEEFSHLEPLCHAVYVCDTRSRILFCNRFARSAFPLIRPGSLFSRFCDLPLSDSALLIRPMLGYSRYFLCRYVRNGRFEIHVPAAMVIAPDQMPRYGGQVRCLLDNVRLAAKRLEEAPHSKTKSSHFDPALAELGERLNKCLSDLEKGSDEVDPHRTVSVYHLLEAVRRRTASDLADADALLSFDCPDNLLCSARLGPTVFILLNLVSFFRICAGVKRLFIETKEEDGKILLELFSPTLMAPTPFYSSLFSVNNRQSLDQSLLATPFSLAAAAASKEGHTLDCVYTKEGLRVTLRLPLIKGDPDLIVRDPEIFLPPKQAEDLSALTRGLLSYFVAP